MPNNNNDSLLLKVAVYASAILLGLGTKLALLNKEKKLSKKEFIYQTILAFAVAFILWQALDYYKCPDSIKNGVAVISGRFADAILIFAWKSLKKAISGFSDDLGNIK